MPLYARSDVESVQSANCPTVHTKKKGQAHLELDCPECQAAVGPQSALFAARPSLIPLTPDEEAARDQEDRDIALAMAAEGQAIRNAATERVRKARAAKQDAAQRPSRRRAVR